VTRSRPRPPIGFSESPEAEAQEVSRAVREFFPPELFNRIDRVLAFRSLTRKVARQIAAKELARLQRRAGLTERRIFVQPTRAVLDRVVEQGFDPVYGARTVQRYLDQRVGAVLAESISASPPAAMRTLHLYCDPRGAFQLHAEALTEAEAETDALPLEPLLDRPVAELQKLLPATLDFLDELQQSPDLERLSERIRFHLERHNLGLGGQGQAGHAEQLYNLESLRQRLDRLRGRVGRLHARRRAERRQVLRCLAEVMFLQRALQNVEQPEQHAVFVELMPLGKAGERPARGGGLLLELAWAYLSRDVELEGWALVDSEGLMQRAARPGQSLELPGLEILSPEQVVLKLVGLNVLDLLSGETGCHVWRSLARGTEVLRVRVLPAPGERAAGELVAEHRQQARLFGQALERGDAQLPENPHRLLPLVREYRFDPPARPGASARLELTDYGLGHATTLHARSLAEGLEPLWLLRMARQGPAPWDRGEGEPTTARVPQEPEGEPTTARGPKGPEDRRARAHRPAGRRGEK
jgi:ATP-dependent Clp protease ATP-binding subunit ClpA/ATP-dependent Clp protease ATP-binding subunit ClpC